MSKVWIINQYNMPPEYGPHNRHYNFAKHLKLMGHEPIVFVGSYLHNTKYQMINDNSLLRRYDNSDFPYYFIKTCKYAKSKIKRIYAMFEFYKNLFKSVKKFEKPDVIIGSSAHPLAAIAAINLGKKYGCKSIVEVRDLWPESFVAYKIISAKNPLLRILYEGEKWIYKNADKIIFTMEGGKDYIVDKGWDKEQGGPIDLNKVYHINNGIDLDEFNYNKEHYVIKDEDLDNTNIFKVVYTGSIGLINNVKNIVDIAHKISNQGYNNIKFIIFGDGKDRIPLEEYCKQNGIVNVEFKGFVDKKYIPYILSKSDLNIMHFEQNSLKRYGASLNKMFDYFASGKPTLSDCEFGYDIIKKYNCGFVMDNASNEQLAKKIIKISKMPKSEYQIYCDNALIAAKNYDFTVLAKKLEKLF